MIVVEVFEGAVVALQLAADLRRPGAQLADPHRGQALLKVHQLVSVGGDELDAVVTNELTRCAVLGDRALDSPPGCGGGEPASGRRPDGEAGVVIEDVDNPRR